MVDTLTRQQKLIVDAQDRHNALVEAGYRLASIPPLSGERVRVAHVLSTSSFDSGATGEWNGLEWSCSIAFISPHNGRVYFTPTHWAPALDAAA